MPSLEDITTVLIKNLPWESQLVILGTAKDIQKLYTNKKKERPTLPCISCGSELPQVCHQCEWGD